MPQSTYQIVTQSVTVAADTNGLPQSFSLTAPTGKKPIAGAVRDNLSTSDRVTVTGSYPSSQTWVFEIVGGSSQHTVDLHLVTADI